MQRPPAVLGAGEQRGSVRSGVDAKGWCQPCEGVPWWFGERAGSE